MKNKRKKFGQTYNDNEEPQPRKMKNLYRNRKNKPSRYKARYEESTYE